MFEDAPGDGKPTPGSVVWLLKVNWVSLKLVPPPSGFEPKDGAVPPPSGFEPKDEPVDDAASKHSIVKQLFTSEPGVANCKRLLAFPR